MVPGTPSRARGTRRSTGCLAPGFGATARCQARSSPTGRRLSRLGVPGTDESAALQAPIRAAPWHRADDLSAELAGTAGRRFRCQAPRASTRSGRFAQGARHLAACARSIPNSCSAAERDQLTTSSRVIERGVGDDLQGESVEHGQQPPRGHVDVVGREDAGRGAALDDRSHQRLPLTVEPVATRVATPDGGRPPPMRRATVASSSRTGRAHRTR